jgi:hypothetical protein
MVQKLPEFPVFPATAGKGIEMGSKPPLETNLGVGENRFILGIPDVCLRLNGFSPPFYPADLWRGILAPIVIDPADLGRGRF